MLMHVVTGHENCLLSHNGSISFSCKPVIFRWKRYHFMERLFLLLSAWYRNPGDAKVVVAILCLADRPILIGLGYF